MRVFKGKQFSRWAAGESISDSDLCQGAVEAFAGQFDADLGGYLFKQRIARSDGGKSGGVSNYLGVPKVRFNPDLLPLRLSQKCGANITSRERAALSANAASLIGASNEQIDALKAKATIIEMECET